MQHDCLDHDPSLARRLQSLPEEPAPYGFAELQRRAARQTSTPRRFPLLKIILSVDLSAVAASGAAAVLLAVIGVSLWSPGRLSGLADEMAGRESAAPASSPAAPVSATVTAERQTATLEGWLASLPADPALVHVGTRAAVASLEDRIALLDDEISAARAARALPAELQAIEAQRSQLLSSLVQVRYAETLVAASR